MQQQGVNVRERREKHRLPFNRLVDLSSPSRGDIQLIGVNYSPSGIAVQNRWPLPIGEQVVLRFRVGRSRQTELELYGEVVHNHRAGDIFITGIRFRTLA
ncbi:MAG: PilZ domain-containing protein, partial [Gammaproteobacteria bacterium]|nr:PilZ domain-containing protein [Gammaproteobacteria bacterium]NIR92315.1 PilZ domain-containing protein [Gammaproteobacteria bacterium]NIW43244.1 hypothetical protein [Gammaproteobacteria bacterium]